MTRTIELGADLAFFTQRLLDDERMPVMLELFGYLSLLDRTDLPAPLLEQLAAIPSLLMTAMGTFTGVPTEDADVELARHLVVALWLLGLPPPEARC